MKLVDWLQILSIAFVAVALILNVLQMRYVSRQTNEAARQAFAANAALRQATYQNVLAQEFHFVHFSNPSLIKLHLTSRGYETGSDEENQRTLYALTRINSHESTFLAYAAGLLDDDAWHGWRNVIRTDFESPKLNAIWPYARQFYAKSYVAFIETDILTQKETRAV
ncbi:hypothetical protein FB565_008761 [Actinoplanes lutulentus]|uniref:hypothetical protein n=1 Tax=Actinoplanes lutulentus TaxID=1287878 RepID=UPI0011B93894|nr:hypothetical protein [Actinoplanes lutulentus]MBB2948975.1 hypothetical protein [Actinoplanes lutulentus]